MPWTPCVSTARYLISLIQARCHARERHHRSHTRMASKGPRSTTDEGSKTKQKPPARLVDIYVSYFPHGPRSGALSSVERTILLFHSLSVTLNIGLPTRLVSVLHLLAVSDPYTHVHTPTGLSFIASPVRRPERKASSKNALVSCPHPCQRGLKRLHHHRGNFLELR